MSKLSSILAWTTAILLVLMFSGLGPDEAFAADRKTKVGNGGIELAPVATSFTLNGYRANGTGSPDVRWVTGSLGNTWAEGEWVPYTVKMTGIPPNLEGLDSIAVSYDFMYPHGSDMYRFVDLIRGIQVGTTVLTDSQGWPASDGSAMPTTTDAELETAQNTPSEHFWTGFTPLNLPDQQINRTLGGGLDVPPGEERHILRINKSDLIAAGVPTNASTVVIYFQLHLARTVVWNNQLQSGYDAAPTDSWGGYVYGTDGWPTAAPMVGSGYVPGSSGHVGMEYPVTGRTVGIPVPEPSVGEASGMKWHDLNGDGVMDGGEPGIPGWEIHVFGTVEGVDFTTSILTDAGGIYIFEHLTPGTIWTIKEDAQRDVPVEVGYFQTYPSVGTTVGVGTGVAVGPPPADAAGVGWSVALTSNDEVQPNMNFGNDRYEIGIICPDDITIACDESSDPSNTGEPTVEGQCPCAPGAVCDPVLTYNDVVVPGGCANEYTIERTWTAECPGEDISVTCVQTITLEDNTNPVITCPADDTFECDETIVFGTATATDNCDPDPAITFDDETIPGSCPGSYTIERTWTATDDCENTDVCVQTITVVDTTDPEITCPADDTFECDETIVFGTATATDNCDPDPAITFDDETIPGSCPGSYTIERTWTATDDCENTDVCVQTITVEDTTDPEITCPADDTFECDETIVFGTATATDNCDPDPAITFDDETIPGSCPGSYTIERTWTATDDCENTDVCVQTITVVDTTDPEITCPADDTFECDETIVFGTATATDNCDPDPAITFDDETIPGSCPGSYTIERTWTATDDCENTDVCVQTITVEDNTDPEITCPADDTFECDETIVFGTATATDNCDPDPAITFDDETIPGSCPGSYTIERTWTATDDCENTDVCVQTITVEDTTDPEITCPADDTFECDETIVFGQATATDNCDPDPEITFDDETIPGSCPGSYTIERTWTATDDCENTDVCVQTITVEDTTDPEITCPADDTFECDETIVFGTATATDNCDPDPAITFDDETIPGSCPGSYTIERTWTATDDCENTDVCVQTITVVDTTDPEITCPADDTFECDETIVFGQATATDNCDPDPAITFDDNTVPGSNPDEYLIKRTWTATDYCGNTDECVQTITVADGTPPEITCPSDRTFECDETIVFGQATATDNCDDDPGITFDDTVIQGDCPNAYTIERIWTAMDAAGNTASCMQVVEVVDTTAPVISCAPDKVAGCLDDVVFDMPTATDNCGEALPAIIEISTVTQPGPGPCQETHTMTWEAEDACGNTSQCSQSIVQVFDETAPVLTCADDKQIACNADVVFDQPTVFDFCDPSPVVRIVSTTMDQGPGECEEMHTRTWEAEDACGNISAQCSQVITRVVDNTAPVLTGADDKLLSCNDPVTFDPPGISDNCDPDPALEVVSTVITDGLEPCFEIHTRCWVGTDACGNESDQVCQSVTVKVDNEAPVLTCAPDKTIPYGEDPVFDEPTATDNCTLSGSFVEISNLVTSDPETLQEVYEQCWTVSDDCNNLSDSCCQRITVEAPPEPYCTFRCWDWGADCLEDPNTPVSTTPACIRDMYFDDLYPDGVMVGKEEGNTAVWTTPRAIEEFLCSYGIPKVLNRDYVNPKRYQLLGVLVGETLCLRLNRDFSCAGYMSGLGYPAPGACYGDYVLPEEMPRFAGLTVDEFLEVCDQAVSGNTAILRDYGANIDHLYAASVYVNWLFSGCNGAPTEPPLLVSGHDEGEITEPTGEPLPVKLSLSVQPNPLYGSTTMRLALPADAEVSIAVYDIQGRKVAGIVSEFKTAGVHDVAWNGTDDRGASLASGVYFCRVQVNKREALMEKIVKL